MYKFLCASNIVITYIIFAESIGQSFRIYVYRFAQGIQLRKTQKGMQLSYVPSVEAGTCFKPGFEAMIKFGLV